MYTHAHISIHTRLYKMAALGSWNPSIMKLPQSMTLCVLVSLYSRRHSLIFRPFPSPLKELVPQKSLLPLSFLSCGFAFFRMAYGPHQHSPFLTRVFGVARCGQCSDPFICLYSTPRHRYITFCLSVLQMSTFFSFGCNSHVSSFISCIFSPFILSIYLAVGYQGMGGFQSFHTCTCLSVPHFSHPSGCEAKIL